MPEVTSNRTDKAGKSHWDSAWLQAPLPPSIDPSAPGLNNYTNRAFHEYLCHAFSGMATRGKKLLEVGCGNSVLLPYLARQFGFQVHGLDYSDLGCAKARQILEREGVDGEIHCEDFFSPSTALIGRFDVVFSWGVAEHFESTTACLSAFARFLRPGGTMITIVPNLVGLVGHLQEALDRAVYAIHVPLDREALGEAHRQAGLQPLSCDYVMLFNLNVVNLEGKRGCRWYPAAVRLRSWVSKGVWMLESALPFGHPNRFTSPLVACIAAKATGEPETRCA